jgi:Na+/melibiose symporter-like transporter
MQQDEQDHIRLARQRVRSKKRFFRHFSVFIAVIGFFFLMNIVTEPDGELWFIYPALVWGVPLAIHYLMVFGLPFTKAGTPEWEERELEREIQRMQPHLPPPQRRPLVNMDEHLELKTLAKEKATKSGYEADDLV